MATRREFLDAFAMGAAAVAAGTTARSYAQILGSNDRLNFAVIGLNGRAYAHLSALKANKRAARISHVCDVDSNILEKFAESVQQEMGYAPATEKGLSQDSRAEGCGRHHDRHSRSLAYAYGHRRVTGPQACLCRKTLQPQSCRRRHARQAQQKYRKLVQMGTQQRSSPHTIEIVEKIHAGLIGRPYFAKAWYSNVRKSIGIGREAPVPPQLDWDLWQGPAPRQLPIWTMCNPITGTGSEPMALARRSITEHTRLMSAAGRSDVDYPDRVSASGGRYQFKDDWQFYDTLVTSFEYEDKLISWEGKSCQGMQYYNRDRGATIMGTTGAVLVDRDGYEIYDLKGNKTSGRSRLAVRARLLTSSAAIR
jgi:hypothetical protein